MAMDSNRGLRETGSRRTRLNRVSGSARISMLRKRNRRANLNVAAGRFGRTGDVQPGPRNDTRSTTSGVRAGAPPHEGARSADDDDDWLGLLPPLAAVHH